MDQFVEGKNPYTILGLEKGQNSTPDDIKKAYRRLALIKHPDKAKSKPNAAQEFDELKKAYAILSDKSARGALDDYLEAQSAREARLAKQDAKRQRLREELERKEREGAAAKSEEEQARARLKVELEALRMRAAEKQQQQQQATAEAAAARKAAQAAAAGDAAGAAGGADTDDETTQLLLRTVKVVWDPSISNYTTDRLRSIFSAGWAVEDVIIKDSHKKKKASALVVLSSIHAAQQAAQEVHGDLHNPLLVTPYLKVMPHAQQQQQQPPSSSTQQQQQQQQHPSGAVATNTSKQALFAAMSTPVPRPVLKPSKPLFPGAAALQPDMTAPGLTASSQGSFSSFPAPSSSFPNSFPAGFAPAGRNARQLQQPAAVSSSKFSSFPGSAGGTSIRVGGQFEDSVLEKLQQKAKDG